MDSTLIAQLLGQMDKSTQESPYSTKGMAYKVLNQMDDFNKESPDYGMDSYIKKNGVPAPYQSMVEYMKGGRHIGDEFKMPNHQTFSTQSSYSAPDMQGGEWKTGGAEGSPYWSFKPSEFNLKQNPIEDLMRYWKSNQPEGTFLQLPDGSYFPRSITEPSDIYGYKVRQPYQSENTFFKRNPSVAGMAAEDNQITLNPYSPLTNERKAAVARNEAMRLYMRENELDPQFQVTPEQTKYFAGMEYGKPENAKYMRQTILGRIFSGDPTANATPEQVDIAKRIAQGLRLRTPTYE